MSHARIYLQPEAGPDYETTWAAEKVPDVDNIEYVRADVARDGRKATAEACAQMVDDYIMSHSQLGGGLLDCIAAMRALAEKGDEDAG